MNINELCVGCMTEKGAATLCPVCGWQEGAVPESPAQLPPRTILNDKYMLGVALGHGGFGITYLAWDITLERKIAIKEYFPHNIAARSTGRATISLYSDKAQTDFEFGLQRFMAEGKALAKFHDHPGIISVLDSFKANGTGYIVMEYVNGVTFKGYLAREGGKISYQKALKILIPVMDSLRAIHKAGMLHRDVSPDNIYITENGQIKLLDFGAARYEMGEYSKSLSVILKDGFSPEEQYRSRGKQGAWTDIYALGATFYRAVTGEVPMQALDRMERDELKPPSVLGIAIPPRAEAQLMKALAVKGSDRQQTVQEFQDILMAQEPEIKKEISGIPVPQPRRKLAFLWPVVSLVLLIGVIICLIGWLNANSRADSLDSQYWSERYEKDRLTEEKTKLESQLENEKKIRNQLAEKWPVSVLQLRVRNEDGEGNVIDDFSESFTGSNVKYIFFYTELQNNWSGIKNLSGNLNARYIRPDGSTLYISTSQAPYSLVMPVEIEDKKAIGYGIGNKDGGVYTAGWHYIQLWWEGEKIGETRFYIYGE